MKTFTIKTATLFEKGHFTGNTISKDFVRDGYISITFKTDGTKLIAIDVNGFEFSSASVYIIDSQTELTKKRNHNFLERFYKDLELENKQILIDEFFGYQD